MIRRAAASGAASLIVLVAGCGGGARDRVEDYLSEVNEAQAEAGGLKAAASIYRRVTTGKIQPGKAIPKISAAEQSVRAVLEGLEGIDPPDEAAELHTKVVRVFELNATMARETTMLAEFVPKADAATKPLAEANERMSTGLERGGNPAAQARALDDYASVLGQVVERLHELEPPPVMIQTHRQRTDQLATVRDLALELRDALRRLDAAAVSDLLQRFIDEASEEPPPGLDPRSVRRYTQRYRELAEASRDVRREESRVRRVVITEG